MLVHLGGLRGINLDLIAEWHYDEKKAGLQKRSSEEEGGSCLRITFATGAKAEFLGTSADALHRYLMTKSRSLT